MAEGREGLPTAPHSVIRHDGDIEQIHSQCWHVAMGSAVGTFMGRAGPPEIVRYSFKSERSHIKATLVEHVPVVEPGLHREWCAVHSQGDLFRLTQAGQKRSELDVKTRTSTQGLRYSYYCAGKSYGPNGGGSQDPCNCRRACGVLSECGCSDKRSQVIAVRFA